MPATAKRSRKDYESLHGKVRELEVENDLLRLKIRALEMAQARPAPKVEDERQLHLEIRSSESIKIEEVGEAQKSSQEAEDSKEPAQSVPSSTTKRGKKQRIRGAEKFANIPVEKETILIPREVEENPDDWKEFDREVTYEVMVQPTRLFRHRIVRIKYRSKINRDAPPIIAKAPIRFCTNYASISLAVYITLSKYLEHGALYRLEQKFARMGADIVRQSQSDIVERLSGWVRPLYELIDKRARESSYLQIDETFIKYINGRGPGIGQGYFWAINSPDLAMVFKWIANRRHENVPELVEGFNGILQSDGYAAYGNHAKGHDAITLAACWAHAFRKFRDALKDEPDPAKTAMHLIGKLYKLEEKWDVQGVTTAERKELRETESLPIAIELKAKLDDWAVDMSIPANKFRDAVAYTAGHWDALLECLRHGHTKLDTNLLESKFHPTKIGAKNWMFIGHPEAGEKSAIVYTLLACCRIHRINPEAYLTDVLEKLIPSDHSPSDELKESLLPWKWAIANPHHLVKEPAIG